MATCSGRRSGWRPWPRWSASKQKRPSIVEAPSTEHSTRNNTPSVLSQQHDRVTLKIALETAGMEWDALPSEMKLDREFARSLACFPTFESVEPIFRHFPDLRDDRDLWMRLIDTLPDDRILYGRVFDLYATEPICADEEVMIRACQRNWRALTFIDDNLVVNRSFWKAVLLASDKHDGDDPLVQLMRLWEKEPLLRFSAIRATLLSQTRPVFDDVWSQVGDSFSIRQKHSDGRWLFKL